MIGYIFETTNKKTGEKYLGKRYAVSFDKNYFGEDEDLAVAIEKYGRTAFEVKMIMPYESQEQLDNAFINMKPAKKVVVKEEEEEVTKEEPVEEVSKPRRRRKAVEG